MAGRKINIESGTELVEVNDSGDTIAFRMSDTAFQRGVTSLSEWAGGIEERYRELTEQLKGLTAHDAEYFNILQQMLSIPDEASERIDAVFGPGTCIKVFGTDSPDILAVSDFVLQMSSVYAELSGSLLQRRSDSMSRYSRHRSDV